jgi:hypothetical protein
MMLERIILAFQGFNFLLKHLRTSFLLLLSLTDERLTFPDDYSYHSLEFIQVIGGINMHGQESTCLLYFL